MRRALVVLVAVVSPSMGAYGQSASDPVANVLAAVPTPPIAFVGITPCRLADTRGNGFTGFFGPPSMAAQSARMFPVAGHCGIPATAQAVSANIAVTNTSGVGFISVWPDGSPQPVPLVASLNYSAGQTIANAVIAALGSSGGINVYARVGLDLIIDVNGYLDTGASGITTRVRSSLTLPIAAPLFPVYSDLAVTSADWTQPAGSLQQGWGWVSFQMPSSCHNTPSNTVYPVLQYKITVDGQNVDDYVTDYPGATGTHVVIPFGQNVLPENPTDVIHHVSVGVSNLQCTLPGEDVLLTGFGIDVVTHR